MSLFHTPSSSRATSNGAAPDAGLPVEAYQPRATPQTGSLPLGPAPGAPYGPGERGTRERGSADRGSVDRSGSERAAGDRLPRPPRRRGAGLAALSVLLIVGGAAAAGLLALRIDTRVDVLVARHDITPGEQFGLDDLAVVPVAADGLDLIPATAQGEVIGKYAAQPIPQGRLIDHRMLAASGLLAAGKAAVGVVIKPGQAPASGLQPGDSVQVVRTTDTGGTPVTQGVVSSVRAQDSGSFGSDSGQSVVTLIVEADKAPDVAAASAGGHLALVLLRRG